MKTSNLCLSVLTAMFCFVSCGQPDLPPSEGSRTGFAISFFKSVNSVSRSGENVVVSPYSAGVALSMLAEGADGETKVELDNALNGCLFKSGDLGGNDTVTVCSANSVWIDNDFSVRNHYVDLLQKDYDALAVTLDFADPATLDAINNWCSENTDGKIDKILNELTPQMVMVLANALYFQAPWLNQFDPEMTKDAIFHGVSGDRDIRMMYRKGRYDYVEYQGCQMIELPYEGGRYSMFVLLPPAGFNVDDLLQYVNEGAYQMALKSMAPAEVRFSFPKMKIETDMMLNQALKKMGVRTAYTAAADFKDISAMGPLSLSQVAQKCYIDITESGTEAAAVTVAVMSLTSMRPDVQLKTMTVDRPFVFFIADKENSEFLFVGKVVDL